MLDPVLHCNTIVYLRDIDKNVNFIMYPLKKTTYAADITFIDFRAVG